ncbi:MAG: NADH:flavin oxidoreductase [Spirochaetes bacterium]|jgi:2,4-dienoyl-CoA reductase-like NADH-dependent reductase (Old Yellow Enzyme family)|nr:NADH:flavin oxidoreductase [Spirochaetota bacterium]
MNQIFEKAVIGKIKLQNRLIRSATFEGMADENGRPLEALSDLYMKIAEGGAGAIITGFAGVRKNGKAFKGMCMIDSDEHLAEYRKLSGRVTKHGTPIIIQLAHAGGQTGPSITGGQAVAPSKKFYASSQARARALTGDEIEGIIDGFAGAVLRAKKAGFSGAQLHAAHGYLLSEFLSPAQNRRNDMWGGDTENRFRIIARIMEKARDLAGDYPIWVKMNAYDFERGGMRMNEALKTAVLFQKHGFDAIEVSCGSGNDGFNSIRMSINPAEAMARMMPVIRDMPGIKKALFKIASPLLLKNYRPLTNYNIDAAEKIKREVDIPVIAVGGMRRLADIENAIAENRADFISMSRPFIIEPGIVNKFRSGRQSESRCINCGICLIGVMENPLKCYNGRVPEAK